MSWFMSGRHHNLQGRATSGIDVQSIGRAATEENKTPESVAEDSA